MRGRWSVPEQRGAGTGHLRSGQRDLGVTQYEIHVGLLNKRETVVELESPPVAQNGEILELILENGQVLQHSGEWRVPLLPRRRRASRHKSNERTRTERVVRHGLWATPFRHPERPGDSTSLSSLHGGRGARHASRRDDDDICSARFAVTDGESLQPSSRPRRAWIDGPLPGPNRPNGAAPIACRRRPARIAATDAYVRSIRRTSDEVYFACDGCEAMWALPRPRSNSPHRSLESR